MEGFIASFERIWERTYHTGCGGCSLHGATVKLNVFSCCLANSVFRILVPSAILSTYLHIFFLQIVVNLKHWYLLHVHFEMCYFLEVEITPCQKSTKFPESLLLYWLLFKYSAIYIMQLLSAGYHEFYGKRLQTTVLQNLLAVTIAKFLKTCLLPMTAIVLSQEQNNYGTARGLYFVS